MKHRGKRYEQAMGQLRNGEARAPQEALKAIKEAASAKFDETVEMAVRLGVDPRKGDQMVRGQVVLPHGTGKSPRVAVITQGEAAQQALEAGADVVGGEDLVARIDAGWRDFDVLVATRDMMRIVGRLGKKLGPRMPNPKAGTVTEDVVRTVRELKGGRFEFRMDKAGNVQIPLGKVSYDLEKLEENLVAAVAALVRARPPAARGQYLKSVSLSTTMGPGVKVDPAQALVLAEKH